MATKIEQLEVGGGYGESGLTISENGDLQTAGVVEADKGAVFYGGTKETATPTTFEISQDFDDGCFVLKHGDEIIAKLDKDGRFISQSGSISEGLVQSLIDRGYSSVVSSRFAELIKYFAGKTSYANSDGINDELYFSNDFSESGMQSTKMKKTFIGPESFYERYGFKWTIPESGEPEIDETKPNISIDLTEDTVTLKIKSAFGTIELAINESDGATIKAVSPNETKTIMVQSTNDGAAIVGIDGMIFTSELATSDPEVAGMVWCDTANGNVLKVSQGGE